jgi:glycerol-3-phosphate acyltransferase PlsX
VIPGQGLPVAVDAMGGDHGPEVIVAGAVSASRAGIPVVLVGDESRVKAALPRGVTLPVVHAPEVVGMGEAAVAAVRRKPDSSLRRAVDLVQRGEASAAVSCGNSGAVVVAAVLGLGVLDQVERPAIAAVLPRSDGGQLVLLDAGANVDCRPEQLACFAILGAAYARLLGVPDPRVGLLANGEEATKGNQQSRATLPLLQALPLRVVGNTEPHAALAGACDVLVCDGFVGNVLVKGVEAAAETVVTLLRDEIKRNPSARFGAWLTSRAFGRFRQRVAWQAYGGGLLLGTRGVVVVGHGRANAEAVHAAVKIAHQAASQGLVPGLVERLAAQR